MNQTVSILIIAYEFGIFPVLIGLLWMGKSERAGFGRIYVRGYLSMFALFEVVAVPAVCQGKDLSALAKVWNAAVFAAAPFIVLILLLRKKTIKEKFCELWGNIKRIKTHLSRLIAVFFVAILFSAVFVLPSEEDDTAEIAAIAIDTDSMYRYETYTKTEEGILYAEKEKSPVEMLYAAGAYGSGMDSTFLIHIMLPFFLLPLFYAVNWEAARYFFGSNLKKCELFVSMVMIFYSVSCYTLTIPAMGAFQNIWNAASLFVCCGMPAILTQCFRLLEAAVQKTALPKKEFLYFIVTVIANQLILARGALLSLLTTMICITIFLFRKGIDTERTAYPVVYGCIKWAQRIFLVLFFGMLCVGFLHEGIRDSWISYSQNTVNIVLLYLALIWIFLFDREKVQNSLYLYTILSVFLVLGLQTVSMLFLHREMMPKTYYLIPAALLISYAGAEISDRIILRKNKWIIMVLYAIIIQAGIGLEYESTYFFGNYNDRKVSSTVMQMADCIEGIGSLKEPFLLAPKEIASQIQEYDVDIRVAYGTTYQYPEDNFYSENYLDYLLELMKEYGSNCLIMKKAYDKEEYMKSKGYRQVIIFDGYSLYYKK